MKNISIVLSVLFLSFLLVACGNSSTSGEMNKKTNEETKETKEIVKTKVADKAAYIWTDDSIGGLTQINTYAIIKNTGNTTVDVTNTKITYLNKEKEVLGVTKANQLYTNISPSIIEPGETSYLGIKDDATDEMENLDDIKIEVSPVAVKNNMINLNPSKEKVITSDNWGGDVKVTGLLKNNTNKDATALEVAAALYSKEDKFLGVLFLSSDDETEIPSKKETSIELAIPGFPSNKINEISKATLVAKSPEIED
ncbi:hypothetical protein ABQG71_15530 [Bacillus altitudinis]|uniref:Lipoprotein n=1 Tax=Bacillus altitudinis TaxID=293387 RepID=A0ABV1S7U0_BACAB